MEKSLKQKTVSGFFWSFMEVGGQSIIRMLIQIVLARLLLPADFGLMGMIIIFINISQIITEGGFTASIIQRNENIPSDDKHTIFLVNLIIGLVLYLALFFTSPIISKFYDQEILTNLIRFSSLVLIFNSLTIVQNALFFKDLKFKKIAFLTIISDVISGILAILLACLGYGVWALVFKSVSFAFIRFILFQITMPWHFKLLFNKVSFLKYFNFGYKLLLISLLNSVFQNIYLLIIGKLYNPSELGFYYQARKLYEIPSRTISLIIQRVTFPVFSKLQDDFDSFKKGFVTILDMYYLILIPLMGLLAVVAKPLIIVLIGAKWNESIVLFQLFCILGVISPIIILYENILNSKGFSNLSLKSELINKTLIVLAILLTIRGNLIHLILGQIISQFISLIITSFYVRKIVHLSVLEQLHRSLPFILTSITMVLISAIVGGITNNYLLMLIIQAAIAIITYIVIMELIKNSAYIKTKRLIIDTIQNRN